MSLTPLRVLWVLLWLLVKCSTAYRGHLIKAVEDTVGAENFTYYIYSEPGPVLLVLDSLSGQSYIFNIRFNVFCAR